MADFLHFYLVPSHLLLDYHLHTSMWEEKKREEIMNNWREKQCGSLWGSWRKDRDQNARGYDLVVNWQAHAWMVWGRDILNDDSHDNPHSTGKDVGEGSVTGGHTLWHHALMKCTEITNQATKFSFPSALPVCPPSSSRKRSRLYGPSEGAGWIRESNQFMGRKYV